MAHDRPSRPRRATNDSAGFDLKLARMLDSEDHQYSSRTDELHEHRKSYVPPYVQDDYNEEQQRPARMPSPPMSETSNPPSMEQQAVLSDEAIAHLTERIKQEVVEHFKQSGNIDTRSEPPKTETIRNLKPTADRPESEPMANVPPNDKSSSTSSPPPSSERVYTPPSPNVDARCAAPTLDSPPLSPVRSLPGSPTVEKPSVRFMNSRGPIDKDGGRNGRTAAYRSSFSSTELSAVDLRWGKLFDGHMKPTPRLGQFLRGLANHIIDDFHPRKSIVVTPDKMAAFYSNHNVEDEVFPLTTIFRSQAHESLSELYQELDCEHHLVQEESFMKPVIPGLTPAGFAHWMTTWILAYPEQEAKRLEKVVVSMPVDADGETEDGKPERLPKQISRYLLPNKEDPKKRRNITDAISIFLNDLGISRTRKPSIASPPISRRTSSSMQPKPRPIDIPQMSSPSKETERDQMIYSKSPTDAEPSREPINIERHRQPYCAKPGSGRVHVESLAVPNATRPGRAYSTGRTPRDREQEASYPVRHTRTQSNASNDQFAPTSRPGGFRKPQSPPINRFSRSNPSNLDTGDNYLPDQFGSPPKQSQPLSPTSSYTTSKYIPTSSEMRDRDSDRYEEPRRSERRNISDKPRSRRNTLNDPSRLPPEIITPQNAERWDRMYENRDKSRDRDRKYEPKSAGPILHQEFRPDPRTTESDLPGEEYYLRPPTSIPRSGEYESSKGGKYYDRR